MREVDYLVTADDIAYLNHYHAQKSPTMQRNRTVLGVTLTLFGVVGFLITTSTSGMGMLLMITLVFSGVLIAMGRRDGPSRRQTEHIRRLFEEGENRALFGHHHIRLLEDKVEVTTEYSQGEVAWEGVERIEQDHNYVFIYVSALHAYAINKKYFSSEENAQSFFQRAKQLHQHARQLESEAPQRRLPGPAQPPAPRPEPEQSPAALPSPDAFPSKGSLGTDGSV